MSDQEHTEVNGLESYGPGDKLDVSESAQLPKDNQIEALLIKYGDDCIDGKAVYTYKVEELLAALATAIRQSLPVKVERGPGYIPEDYTEGKMDGINETLDQLIANLKAIGLEGLEG